MSLLQNSNAISAGGYDINNSLRFRSSASAYLNRTPGSAGNRKTWTWSGWVKRGSFATGSGQILFSTGPTGAGQTWNQYYFETDNTLRVINFVSGSPTFGRQSDALYRDPSAWYHVVILFDTTQATDTNRLKFYVNGSQITTTTSSSYSAYPTINLDGTVNNTVTHGVGGIASNSYLDGYLAEVNFIDGQALTPSSFGETDAVTGSWVAKKYTGTYGTNGFYLPFSDTEANENRFLYSEDFANAAWTKGAATVTSNTVVAPDGTTTADTLTDNATSDQHLIVQAISTQLVGSQYTMSIYAKANTRSQIGLTMHGESAASFDLTAGTVLSSGGFSNVGIQSVGNGWYRCYVTITKTNVTPNIYYIIYKDGVNPYLGTGTGSIYIWGAQITYGPTLHPYIRTTTATVTNRGTTENALTYSQDFTNAAWTKGAVTITANTTTSPDGTTTASKLVENATLNVHGMYRTFTESNVIRTVSIYAKLADASRPYLYVEMSDFVALATATIFNISNGTIYQQPNTNANYRNTSASITSVGNGWYRCTLTATKGAVNPNNNIQIALCDATGNPYYTGSGTTLGVFIWGAQFEEAINVGPYWPTVASAQSKVLRIGSDKSLGSTVFGYDSWIANNISLIPDTTYDAMTDVPTNTSATVANYAVLNPLNKGANATLSNANLNWAAAQMVGGNHQAVTSIAMSSGKWYCEFTPLGSEANGCIFGIVSEANVTGAFPGNNTTSYGYAGFNGNKYNNGASAYGATFTLGDIIGIAFDADARTLTFYKNNTSQGTAFSSIPAGSYYFGVGNNSSLNVLQAAFNAGQRPFAYTPPTGFKALNTYNLPDSTILKGNKYMDATLYTGNGSSQTIVNQSQFRPDFVWLKSRSNAFNNYLWDTVRGGGIGLFSDLTAAENNYGTSIQNFTSTGFSIGNNAGINTNGSTFVAWQWASTPSAVTNTNGSISSQVRANPTTGFSVVTYTGTGANATVGHGLGVAPRMIIFKRRDSTSNWPTYHASTGNTGGLYLNGPNTFTTSVAFWNNTSPTSSVFTVGGANEANASSSTNLAYCWAEIAGFSKFGSYTGNGSADGTFVFTGFRPKFVMVKRTDTTGEWLINDSSRDTYNPEILYLQPHLSSAEGTLNPSLDFLSNGFKFRTTNANYNASGGTYIYMAFAENPFKNANAR